MKRLIYIVPVLAFVALALILFAQLSQPQEPGELPSALIGKPAPVEALPALDDKAQGFGAHDLASGRVTVVNIWASWCAPCRAEAPALTLLSTDTSVQLFGIAYQDKPANARAFLNEVGNPFARVARADGSIGIEWGISGVPETFVIDGRGIVRARITGALTDGDKYRRKLLPAIAAARAAP
ncbi:MAG TPA: DsbE family thiol:disulfide interchange protein [Rhizomicrobium sp.]|nr:DsbE family thiol:disulfide interchange protein [Rhizomicrobium sp.]